MKKFHEDLCDIELPDDYESKWKTEVFYNFPITPNEECRSWFNDGCFRHLADLGKDRNKRIYIGPGRDGSSDDKISIDCKFENDNTKVPFSRSWLNQ